MKEGWDNVTLGSVCQKNSNIKWADQNGRSFKYIDLSSVSRDDLIITETAIVNSVNAPSRAKKIVLKDDVIFATTRPTLKRVTIINEEYDNQICSTGYAVLRPIKDKVDSRFIYYFILSEEFMNRMENLQRGASYPAVSDKDVKSTSIWIPKSLSEQKKIVTLLDAAFAKIDQAKANIEKNIANAKELFQSKLDKIFDNYILKGSTKDLGTVIEILTDYHSNGSYKTLKKNVELKDDEDYAWMVRSTDFEKKFKGKFKYINEHAYNHLAKSKIFGGELIISKIGNAGKVYVMPEIYRPCSLAMNLFLLRLKKEEMSSKYLYYYLKSSKGEKQILSKLNGTTTKTITKASVRDLIIPIVDIDTQNKATKKFESIKAEVNELESIYNKKLHQIEQLKKSLLQKAFAGELT